MVPGCSQTTKNLELGWKIRLFNIQFLLYNENIINANLKLMEGWYKNGTNGTNYYFRSKYLIYRLQNQVDIIVIVNAILQIISESLHPY